MSAGRSRLGRAFLNDHRALTRALARLAAAVEEGRWVEAKQLAEQVDREGGAHIEFEETVLYPAVARRHGKVFVKRLHDEHRAGLDVVQTLLTSQPDEWTTARRSELTRQAQTAWRHAESCGTLLSQLTVLGDDERESALAQLETIRKRARSWIEWARQVESSTTNKESAGSPAEST